MFISLFNSTMPSFILQLRKIVINPFVQLFIILSLTIDRKSHEKVNSEKFLQEWMNMTTKYNGGGRATESITKILNFCTSNADHKSLHSLIVEMMDALVSIEDLVKQLLQVPNLITG